MPKRFSTLIGRVTILIVLIGVCPRVKPAELPEPIVYTIKIASPETHIAEVVAVVPTGGRESIELMMPIWSPGFYRVEDYAKQIRELSARTEDGKALDVTRPKGNRWLIRTGGTPRVVVSYRLSCEQRSVTTNWVGEDLVVLNGPATFLTLVEKASRSHEVHLELPATLARSMTALDPAEDDQPNHYRAKDYDTLVDSPILAGKMTVREFELDRSKHTLVDAGDVGKWDNERAARDLEKIVRENRRLWGSLPFKRYLFLNVFRRGGGGLEHKNSTLLTSSPLGPASPQGYLRWLDFVSHEYFHAFNVKRLRPIELGPFDSAEGTPPRMARTGSNPIGPRRGYRALVVTKITPRP
jgi:predicted metalloprotease with PDZ domain